MRPFLQTIKVELTTQVVDAKAWFWSQRIPFVASLLVFGLLAYYTVPFDKDWVEFARNEFPQAYPIAKAFTFWGDYPFIGLLPAMTLIVIGYRRARINLLRFGLALLMASSCGGLTTNLVRNSLGRPRPMAQMPDGLYGPSLDYKFHGSPSAHAGAAFGAATFIAVAIPPVGVPALGLASGIGWSRVYLRAHHPTDVAFGALLGAWAGLCFGIAYRRRTVDSNDLTP